MSGRQADKRQQQQGVAAIQEGHGPFFLPIGHSFHTAIVPGGRRGGTATGLTFFLYVLKRKREKIDGIYTKNYTEKKKG